MTEDKLGSMSNAHLVQVDQNGARSYESLKLAESISKALDCSKSGEHVIFPGNLKPKAYPHYMEKTGVKTYISGSILGKLYDQVKELNVDELSSREIHCDPDLVISGAESFKEEALTYKKSYDLKIAEIQHLYSVSEVEIVTGNFWSLPKGNKQNSLKQKIMLAYENIWREFRSYFEYLGPDIADFSDREKQTQYEAKASCWYQITYGAESTRPLLEEHAQEKILSFPWIAVDYLCCTKKQKSDRLS
ncbi:hypothetical protein CQW23_15139 [Capsicum baccatum]|uniref:RNA-dependent RNA polymerase n=1 Tax=Capsicum baccatum TaxID=33114 RepID=A0A2G2WL77_CAPBA|nr:hypothetical protein CQW23_15139 [Capsicum baccatum]